MTCVCHSFHLFRGIGIKHMRKFNLSNFSTVIQPQADPIKLKPASYDDALVHQKKQFSKYGITHYTNSPPSVYASIKDQSEYFQVHEIDTNGNRVQLTNLDPLPPESGVDEDKKFIHFTLYKKGLQTTEVAGMLLHKLSDYGYKHVNFAGRKDKKAQTSQRMSVPNFSGVCDILPKLSTDDMVLGNFNYAPSSIQIGHLKGNHFNILLRNLLFESIDKQVSFESMKLTLDESVKNFIENGFINYFGLQRFGINSHEIGAAVIASKWEKVFDFIFAPWPTEEEYIAEIKSIWGSTRDVDAMMKLIPPCCHHSVDPAVRLTIALSKFYKKKFFFKAYNEIPSFVRSIHLSAFRSFVWNHVASYRIQEFGLKVIPGDFVGVEGTNDVQEVTERDVNRSQVQYSIFDVVLPVLGAKFPRYTNPKLQEFCSQLLLPFGLSPDSFEKFKLKKEVNHGSHRTLVAKPDNVAYKLISSEELINLKQYMPSDLDLLKASQVNEGQGSYSIEDVQVCTGTPQELCLIVEFSLPKSAYATMAIREIIQ